MDIIEVLRKVYEVFYNNIFYLLSYIFYPKTNIILTDDLYINILILIVIVIMALLFVYIPHSMYKRDYAKEKGKIPELSGKYKEIYDMHNNLLLFLLGTIGLSLLTYFGSKYISNEGLKMSFTMLFGAGIIGTWIVALWLFINSIPFLHIKRNMII